MVMVANKTDCKEDRIVSPQDGEELAKVLKVFLAYWPVRGGGGGGGEGRSEMMLIMFAFCSGVLIVM